MGHKLHISWWGKMLLVAAGACGVLFVRRPDAMFNPQFWAEDFIFLLEAESQGLRSLVTPRAGYLHLIPRSIAYLGRSLDPFLQPGFFVFSSALVVSAVALLCISRRHDLPGKLWLALSVVVVAHSGEVFLNPTNVQWVSALGLMLTILKEDPSDAVQWIIDVVTLVFAGLSGPFIILFLPFFLWRAYTKWTIASTILAGIALVLAGIQFTFVWAAGPDTEFTGAFSLLNFCANLGFRLPYSLILGSTGVTAMGREWVIVISFAILGFVVFGIATERVQRRACIILFGCLAAIIISTELRKRFDVWIFGDLENGDRYWYIPKVVMFWLIGIFASGHQYRAVRIVSFALIGSSLVLNSPRFRLSQYTDYKWYELCPKIRAGETVDVLINPGWKFRYKRPDN